MEDGWSLPMAESLPTLSRPESEEAKPGTWEADGSPTTGERLHGEWGLGPQGICGWHGLQRQGLDLEYSESITHWCIPIQR